MIIISGNLRETEEIRTGSGTFFVKHYVALTDQKQRMEIVINNSEAISAEELSHGVMVRYGGLFQGQPQFWGVCCMPEGFLEPAYDILAESREMAGMLRPNGDKTKG